MGTFVELSSYGTSREKIIKAMDDAFREIKRIEGLFSKYDEASEISRINRLAGERELIIAREVFDVIEHSLYYSKLSDGAFDITVAPLMDIWRFDQSDPFIPDDITIENALEYIGYEKVVMNKENLSVHFLDSRVKIDLGGIVKGYAVDRAKEVLRSGGLSNALINIGGNIYAMGSPPNRRAWQVGIQDPRDRDKLVHKLDLKDGAVSTSGDYEKFFIVNGKRYFHILDPRTGRPVQGAISVTVLADSAEEADALSTAAFVMGIKRGEELARSLGNRAFYIDIIQGFDKMKKSLGK